MPTPNPIAFTILGFEVRWYGVLMATAIIFAVLILIRRAPRHNLKGDDVIDIMLVAIPAGIIFSRLYYIVFNWSYYSGDPAQILNFRGGGLAIHGALIGGFLGAYFVCRHKKISFIDGLDMTVPTIALAQSIGRWGNYFNSEAHGGPTDLPWAITIAGEKVHPTFLYESIWCLILFFVLIYVDNHRRFVGQVACLYGMLYSIERIFVEDLRTDSLMIGSFRQAQVLSAAVILFCAIAYLWLYKRCRNKKQGESI